MDKFTIIDSQDDWNRALQGFKNIDCYYSFEYGSLFARLEHGQLFAAYYESKEVMIFYPFIKRKVSYFNKDVIYDIVTPYGYGGPIVTGKGSIKKFYEIFSLYCTQNRIITETIRFHPLYKNHHFCKEVMEVSYIRDTVAVDLTTSLDTIRSNYTSMNKRNIKKARKNHLTCYIADKTMENCDIFLGLYKETMDRNSASSYYYFDEIFFREQLKDTSTSNSYLLFAKKNQEIVAGVIVLIGQDFAHYHLGASKTDYLDVKPNNLLFDFMIEFCKKRSAKVLHLGGGYRGQDGLFKFKASFSNRNYEYFIGKKVHNEAVYKEILAKLKDQGHLDESYFPVYRGQIIKEKPIYR